MSGRSFEDAETGDAADFRDVMMVGWYRVGAVSYAELTPAQQWLVLECDLGGPGRMGRWGIS